jgi:hypothetical protein
MEYYIGCDAHKKYSVFAGISDGGEVIPAQRVEHNRESHRSFLKSLPPASQIAVESVGKWYWMVDEMENNESYHEPGGNGWFRTPKPLSKGLRPSAHSR